MAIGAASKGATLVTRLQRKSDGAQCVDLVELADQTLAVDKHTLVTTVDPQLAAAALRELDMHLTLLQAPPSSSTHHVVQLISYWLDSERLHLLHEFCARGDLLAVLRHESRMETAGFPRETLCTRNESGVRAIFAQTLQGVAALHSAGIAHLDLSLENVFVTAYGDVRVGDLGHAERFQRSSNGRVVHQCPLSVAKAAYAAPEIHTAGIPIDVTMADTWALGVILWQLWTKSPLVRTATHDDPLFCRMERDGSLVALEAACPVELAMAPPELRDLLVRLLTIDPLLRLSVSEALHHPWITSQPLATVASPQSTTTTPMVAVTAVPQSKLRRIIAKPPTRTVTEPSSFKLMDESLEDKKKIEEKKRRVSRRHAAARAAARSSRLRRRA